MTRTSRPAIVFAGSGTAGHLYPGVGIAADLIEAGMIDSQGVVFVGAAGGTGRDQVEAAGFRYRVLEGVRPLRGRSLGSAAASLFGAARAFLAARKLLREFAPSAVVGIGGYASFPVVAAAASMGIPVTVLQIDATLGLANGAGSLVARSIPVAFPAGRETFEKSRIGRTALRRGAALQMVRPCVRPEIEELAVTRDPSAAKRLLGLDRKRPLVAFVGGSLGAGPINDAAFHAYKRWTVPGAPQVVAVTGTRFFEPETSRLLELAEPAAKGAAGKIHDSIKKELAAAPVEVIRVEPAFVTVGFVGHIERLYAAADAVVSRAGAVTVGELAASGTPAVLMPSSYVAGDHQRPNAEALARRGGAVIAYDTQVALVPSIIERLLERPGELEAMRKAGLEGVAAPVAAYEVVADVARLRPSDEAKAGTEAVW